MHIWSLPLLPVEIDDEEAYEEAYLNLYLQEA